MSVFLFLYLLATLGIATELTLTFYEDLDNPNDGRSAEIKLQVRRWAPLWSLGMALLWPLIAALAFVVWWIDNWD